MLFQIPGCKESILQSLVNDKGEIIKKPALWLTVPLCGLTEAKTIQQTWNSTSGMKTGEGERT